MDTNIYLSGFVRLGLFNKEGKLLWEKSGSNIVVQAGFDAIAKWMGGGTVPDLPSHMALGSGGAFLSVSDTQLDTEITNTRSDLTKAFVNNVVTYSADLVNGSGSLVEVTEIGIFDAVTAGTMWARFKPGDFGMDSGDSLSVDWALTIDGVV